MSEAITDILQLNNGFGAIMDLIKPILGKIDGLLDVFRRAKEWFEPFFWVLVSFCF